MMIDFGFVVMLVVVLVLLSGFSLVIVIGVGVIIGLLLVMVVVVWWECFDDCICVDEDVLVVGVLVVGCFLYWYG